MSKFSICFERSNNCPKGFELESNKSKLERQQKLKENEQQEEQKEGPKVAKLAQKKGPKNYNETKVSHDMNCYRLKLLTYNKIAEQLPNMSTDDDGSKRRKKKPITSAYAGMTKVKDLCEALNCPQMGYQMEKLTAAQDQLMRIQRRDLFDRVLDPGNLCFCVKGGTATKRESVAKSIKSKEIVDSFGELEDFEELMGEEEDLGCYGSDKESIDLPPENEWHGYFAGYEILSEKVEFSVDELKKCIEIGHADTVSTMETHLRSGVRCFMIDLFKGNSSRNQTIVVRFRQSELNVAKELGFPVTSTLFARLSPRLQYTGYLAPPHESVYLRKNDYLTMTTDRYWASRCSKRRIFVNARYLMPDIHRCDVLLIGTEIQVVVIRVLEDSFRCKVLYGGILCSRMPVLFNRRCHRFRLSFCELEDITFVKEVGINVIVSSILGTKAYYDNLCECLKLLQCSNLRLFACVTLNNIDDDETNVDWARDAYDGYMGEISQFTDGCGGDGNMIPLSDTKSSRILFINPNIRKLIESAHRSHKPFILDVAELISGRYIMDPECYKLVLYHPDKYLFPTGDTNLNWFFMLANALGSNMPYEELNKLIPYCDESHTGSDTLALSTAAASLEMNATCIFVVGNTGRMATKIASFRPKATIFFISSLKSAANFISIHHNIIMLYYDTKLTENNHQKSVYTQFLFALSYALTLKSLSDGEQVLFVYGHKPGQLFLDKYVAYKFDEQNFVRDLACILF